MKRNKSKHSSSFGFTDLLFNLLVGFVFLFFIAYLLINPIAKKGIITPPDKVIISALWDPKSTADVDMWMQAPDGEILSFQNKVISGAHLEKDDLGDNNDAIWVNGVRTVTPVNIEVIHIQGLQKGVYYVTLHAYNLRREGAKDVDVTIRTLDPYRLKASKNIRLQQSGQEKCTFMFETDDRQRIIDVKNCTKQLVVGKLTQEYETLNNQNNDEMPPRNTRIP